MRTPFLLPSLGEGEISKMLCTSICRCNELYRPFQKPLPENPKYFSPRR
nr:hypothetical protein Iba_scaffold56035CG0010 [Ipomoea batatas]